MAPGRTRRPVKFRTSFSNTIYDVLCSRNWKETDSETDWDLHWAEREWVYEVFDTMHLEAHQRLNHFRNGRELCRKDLLVKNLKRTKRTLQRDGQLEQAKAHDFMPLSFVLPREYSMFVEEFKRSGGVWIMKPIGSAQGKGIFLFSRLSEISDWRTTPAQSKDEARAEPEAYVVQRYIPNPYLIGGKKFDIRLYVLVTSFSPLVAYLYRGGFARFSHTRYSSDPADIANNFVHLTNVAIQKTAENYDVRSGGKKDLKSLKLLMAARHGLDAVDQLFLAIERVVVRSLLSVQHVMIADKHCFELFGYDILIDDDLKPWLIEVNASPSLTANTREDYVLKCDLLNDTLDIVDLEGKLRGDEASVGGFDLVYDGGLVEPDPALCPWATRLGTAIERPPQPEGEKGASK
ncbi:tubulin-tyrosine ligase family-domain-containing protein [Pelagophyceae sp. CCMP2097]|nr:tubulin-tyrosine ligase family-domain-containing protein [Pelagophyceae sp. CCMP2097]|mmetsp:Transcript_10647/g.35317  ORF Transcript_10647/g.35317 Transcript_10647/m.35317 type:complete len:405 (-) Transcript_10647:32-1246(-)